jgi:hypothetical protein
MPDAGIGEAVLGDLFGSTLGEGALAGSFGAGVGDALAVPALDTAGSFGAGLDAGGAALGGVAADGTLGLPSGPSPLDVQPEQLNAPNVGGPTGGASAPIWDSISQTWKNLGPVGQQVASSGVKAALTGALGGGAAPQTSPSMLAAPASSIGAAGAPPSLGQGGIGTNAATITPGSTTSGAIGSPGATSPAYNTSDVTYDPTQPVRERVGNEAGPRSQQP